MPSSRLRRTTRPVVALLSVAALSACGDSGSGTSSPTDTINIYATDTKCRLDKTRFAAGTVPFAVKNSGSKVTEVYIFAGKRIVAEKENIGPGMSYKLTASLKAGSYQVACKPGMTGDGIRTTIKVTGTGGTRVNPDAKRAVANYRAYVQSQVNASLPVVDAFVAAVTAKAYEVLKPLIVDEALVTQLDTEFANVQAALDKHQRGGSFVSYDTVDADGRRELSRVVDALSEPLSMLTASATG
jgi:iron uptake system component EfeO